MQKQEFKNGVIYQGDCLEVIDSIDSYDHVITDPPYGYLKHRIETFFDYKVLFPKIRDKISDKGGVLIFGRGDLFYEWNLFLRDLGFGHKEDCTLYKNIAPNFCGKILRQGEYFSIRGLKGFTLNKVYIPITDKDNISDNSLLYWLRTGKNSKKFRNEIIDYIKNNKINSTRDPKSREKSIFINTKRQSTALSCIISLIQGKVLGNVLHSSRELLSNGWSHPTIKPSKEIGYLVQAISNENDTILDPFLGSGTTAIACINTNRRFIGIELDQQYFDLCCERIHKRETEYLF